MFRRLIRHPASQASFAWILGLYLALVFRTTRWTLLGQANLDAALGPGAAAPNVPGAAAPIVSNAAAPILAAFWHERLPMMPMLWLCARAAEPRLAAVQAHVLVSRHRDGRFIGEVVRRFRLVMVHASTSHGGAAGLRALLRVLGQGDMVVITPDGPRGPRRRAAPGVAQLAALAGVPVLPCAARTSRAVAIGSWDRMVLPLPFARGVLVLGPPVPVERIAPLEALPAIEAALTAACDAADAWVATRGWIAA